MTVLPASSRFSDLNAPTSSERVTRFEPSGNPPGLSHPMPTRSGPFPDIRRMNAHLQSPLFLPLITQNTPDRHNRDHFALAWPKILSLSAIILVTEATCTQSRRVTFLSSNEGMPFLRSHWSTMPDFFSGRRSRDRSLKSLTRGIHTEQHRTTIPRESSSVVHLPVARSGRAWIRAPSCRAIPWS